MFEAAKKRMEERQKEKEERERRKAERQKMIKQKRLEKKNRNSELYFQAKKLAPEGASIDEIQLIFKELQKKFLTN